MRRRLAVLLATACLALAAGCGSGGSGDLQQVVLASAEKAADVDTARFAFTASIPGEAGQPAALTGVGAVDNTVPLISMDMDTGNLVPGAGLGAKMSFLYDGTVFYMRFPDELAPQLGGKHWIRFDPATIPPGAGVDFDALLAQFRSSDPLANMSLLAGAGEDVSEVGEEIVRGVDTRHFKLTVDVRKSVAQAPEQVKASMSKLAEGLGTETLPVDVWIGDDGLPRRLAYEVDVAKIAPETTAGTGAAPQGRLRTVMELFNYGEPVKVTTPPEDDTVDLGKLAGQPPAEQPPQ